MQHADRAFRLLKKDLPSLSPMPPVSPNGPMLLRGRFRENASVFVGLHPNKSIVEKPIAKEHMHDYIEIVYVHRGSCHQVIEDEAVHCGEGSIVLLNKHARHTIWVDSDQDIVVNIGIRCDTVQQFVSTVSNRKAPCVDLFESALFDMRTGKQKNHLHIDNALDIDGLITEMFCEYYQQNNLYEHILLSDFIKLMIQLCRYGDGDAEKADGVEDELAHDIFRYIEANYMQLSMEALSERFNYSQRQIRRLLRRVTDDSLPDMLNRLKIQKACEYIDQCQMSTEEILRRVDYCDANYFYKKFRSVTGMSVIDYRHKAMCGVQ